MNCFDPETNARYQQAHAQASQEMRKGTIRSFSCSHDRKRGRVITVETDQGWNPDPFYEDFPVEADSGDLVSFSL